MRPHKPHGPRNRSAARRQALPRELNVGRAKALLSRLVDEAARGARFTITKAGRPVARIVPLDAGPEKFVFGTMKGMLSQKDEQALLDAIEAPLSDDVLAALHVGPPVAPDK